MIESPRIRFLEAEMHILDLMGAKLKPALTYHGVHHTLDVLTSARRIAESEKIEGHQMELLQTAVYFHDSGFMYVYQGHEEKGCEICNEILPLFGFEESQIQTISGMIRATKIPQQPVTQLEKIIADADLDYLGRDDFYPIGKTLFDEMKVYFSVKDERQWNEIQFNFLNKHHYHTQFGITQREPQKQMRLREIEEWLRNYEKL